MPTPNMKVNGSTREHIIHKLMEVGVPTNLKGYEYLKTGLALVLENPDIVNYVTTELYPGIAKENGTTASRVERAIRHAIEVVFDRTTPDYIEKLFGTQYMLSKGKVTNSEFICRMAEVLRMEAGLYA